MRKSEGLRFANSIKIERECISMDKASQSPRSHLFTVRVWQEEVRNGQTEWRGGGKMLTSGGGRSFSGLGTIYCPLLTVLFGAEVVVWSIQFEKKSATTSTAEK